MSLKSGLFFQSILQHYKIAVAMIIEMSEVPTLIKIPTFNQQWPRGLHEELGLPINQNRLLRIVPGTCIKYAALSPFM